MYNRIMTNGHLGVIRKYTFKEMGRSLDLQHDFLHTERVCLNAEKIVKLLNFEKKIDINLLKAMAYLHDIHFSKVRPGLTAYIWESKILRKILPKIMDDLLIDGKERKLITEAILNHPHSIPFRKLNLGKSIYAKILQDADSVDFFSKERESNLKKSKKVSYIYWFANFFSGVIFQHGRRSMSKFLNFPEIAEHFYR